MKKLSFIIEQNEACSFFKQLDDKSQMNFMEALQNLVISGWKKNLTDETWEGDMEGTFLTNLHPIKVTLHVILGPKSGVVRVKNIIVLDERQAKVVHFIPKN